MLGIDNRQYTGLSVLCCNFSNTTRNAGYEKADTSIRTGPVALVNTSSINAAIVHS